MFKINFVLEFSDISNTIVPYRASELIKKKKYFCQIFPALSSTKGHQEVSLCDVLLGDFCLP